MGPIRRGLPAAMLVALTITLAGCGSDGADQVATAGGATGGADAPSVAADVTERVRQYVDCLRGKGLRVADPAPGSTKVQLEDRDQPGFHEALRACQQFAPDTATGAGDEATRLAAAREFAACMRVNGMPAFPDPDPDKGAVFPKELATDAAYESAYRACAQHLGDLAGGK